MPNQGLSMEQRQSILQREISGYVKRGFIVQSQTDTTAQLVKRKQFSLLWAILWTFVVLIGLLFYIFYYMAKKDETVYLTVDENGKVRRS